MAVTSSDDIVPTLATAALLNSSLAAQTELAPVSRFVQVSIELTVFNNFLGPSVSREDHRLFFAVEQYQEEASKMIVKLERCEGHKENFFKTILLLKSKI